MKKLRICYRQGVDLLISVVTSTFRSHMLERVIENFTRQNLQEKELILILNKDSIQFENPSTANIRVFRLDEAKTLGECLNFGASLAKYNIIAKMDDDDYYSPQYLTNSLRDLQETKADVVGKAAFFVYFKHKKLLSVYRPRMNHLFIKNKKLLLSGGTLVFKKEILQNAPFPHLNNGEDILFQQNCLSQQLSIYSGGQQDYVLIRHGIEHQHSWQVDDELFLKHCKEVTTTDSFESFVWDGSSET